MKTTVLIKQSTGERLKEHASKWGVESMSGMAEMAIRKALDFIDCHGYDEFIKISSQGEADECMEGK